MSEQEPWKGEAEILRCCLANSQLTSVEDLDGFLSRPDLQSVYDGPALRKRTHP